jgi:hypothetical protein
MKNGCRDWANWVGQNFVNSNIILQVASFQFASMVADIFDRYNIKNSIKSAERERRSKSFFTAKVFQIIEGRIIPDLKKIVSKARERPCL